MQRIATRKKVNKFKALGYKVVKRVQGSQYGSGSVRRFLMEKPDPAAAPPPKPVKKK